MRSSSSRSTYVQVLLAVLLITSDARGAFAQAAASGDAPPAFQAYSKFDFVPGERIVGLEDFSQDSIGDFPAK